MKSIKEKQLMVKWAKAMNEPIDPELLEEVERYEQLKKEIVESVRLNTINDLNEAAKVAEDLVVKINLEYPKPPTLEEVLSVLKEEQDELVQAQSKEIQSTEATPAPTPTVEPSKAQETLVEKAAVEISKQIKLEEKTDSFQQPEPVLTNKNLNDIVKKLKFLEQAIGRIAATGPGSGEVNLRWLDDINRESIPSDNSDKYLRYSQTNNNFEFAVVSAQAANGLPPGGLFNDIIVKVDETNYNVAWKKPDTLFAYVRNAEAYTINKGNAVYLYQASGDKASVKQAFNSGDTTSARTLGLAAENITSGSLGNIITQGPLIGLNLKDYNEGDTLYLGNVSGQLTKYKPFAPEHIVFIGVVERANQGQGVLYVRAQNGYELDELHNVNIDHTYSLANGHVIIYNTANSLWENNYLTTDHVVERGNLYFTNSRVISALTAGQNISIAANGLITSNATGGGGAVSSVNGLTGAVQLYTANITESGNLYFTNERAISAFTAGQGIVLQSNGLIVSTATGTVTGVNGQTGNVSLSTSNIAEGSNLYFSNSRVYDNVTSLGYITSASLSGYATNNQLANYATNSQLGLYATNSQLALYSTNAQAANFATIANINLKANTSDLNTSNVTEGTNLYFTNTRAVDAVVATGISSLKNGSDTLSLDGANKVNLPGGTSYIFSSTNNITIAPDSSGDNALEIINNVGATLYTDSGFEIRTNTGGTDQTWSFTQGGSFFFPDSTFQTTAFTTRAVYANVLLLGHATNSQLALYATNAQLANYATNNQLSLYATNAQLSLYTTNAQAANFATIANINLKANTSDLTTSNVSEITNLYYTNARVYANVLPLSFATNSQLALYATNAQLGSYATNSQLTLYATNAQAATFATIANINLKANTADLNTSNVTEGTNLYFTNARVKASLSTQTLDNATFSGALTGSSVGATNGIIVNSNTITANYTIQSGFNGMSIGPITIDSNTAVTISNGSIWTII